MNSSLYDKRVVTLDCNAQCSSWGKVGEESTVAQLLKNNPDFKVDHQQTYAELWMGTHPNFKTTIRSNKDKEKIPLANFISTNSPTLLGEKVAKVFANQLPFLFKVLSINKSLSIQAHPSKELAVKLHRENPAIYKDPNHKPEMAIALTKFEALCGFRPVKEILMFFTDVKELIVVCGQNSVDALISADVISDKEARTKAIQIALRGAISGLMNCDKQTITTQLDCLVQRVTSYHTNLESTARYLGPLFLRTHSQFPGDVGCFFVYFLNHIILEPYESIYLGPSIPHAYLAGDIVECMASSDNVVRLGLTPKFKDVKLLIEMLEYTPRTVAENKFQPKVNNCEVTVYNPPADDFSVRKILLEKGCSSYTVDPIDGPSILLVLSGSGQYTDQHGPAMFGRGTVMFVAHTQSVHLTNISSQDQVLMFQAYCDLQ